MSRNEFEKLVAEAFDAIPEKFQPLVKNVVVMVEEEPSKEVREIENLSDDETLLGYYKGIPHTERGSYYGIGETLPDVITIFQKPIEEVCEGDPERIKKEVRETVWHEFAHHFGLDDYDISEREFKDKN